MTDIGPGSVVVWACGWLEKSHRCLRFHCHRNGPCGGYSEKHEEPTHTALSREAKRMIGWRTIDTAPKTGLQILLGNSNTVWEDWWASMEDYEGWFRNLHDPTHWMPLPSPPGEK